MKYNAISLISFAVPCLLLFLFSQVSQSNLFLIRLPLKVKGSNFLSPIAEVELIFYQGHWVQSKYKQSL